MPRTERFGIGTKIDGLFLETLDYLQKATYARGEKKLTLLKHAVITIDSLKFFLQLAWESALIAHTQYASLGEDVEELGRMVGGWKKGIEAKTPASEDGRKK